MYFIIRETYIHCRRLKMNIVKRELRSNLKSLIIWSVAIAFLVSVWMIEYGSFANNPAIDDFMAALPQGLLSAMGMQDLMLNSLTGFIGTIGLYMYLLLGIHATLLGSSIISKEERDKTAEYLFTLPVSRKRVILGKMISSVINLAALNMVTLLTMILSTMNYEKDPNFNSFMVLTFLAIFIIQMVFFSIGLLVSAVNKRYKKSGNISVSILMITFLISSLISMVDSVDFLKYLTPFKYFESSYIQNQMSLEPIFIVLSVIIIVVGITGTFILYPKRDLFI